MQSYVARVFELSQPKGRESSENKSTEEETTIISLTSLMSDSISKREKEVLLMSTVVEVANSKQPQIRPTLLYFSTLEVCRRLLPMRCQVASLSVLKEQKKWKWLDLEISKDRSIP